MKPEHIVVLMFENRSFDHLLGHLSHGGLVPVDAGRMLSSDRDVTVDPGHGFADVTAQLTGAPPPLDYEHITMNGFEANYATKLNGKGSPAEIMGCHTAQQVPVLSTLAREYAVCSRWFCSVPSETWPNRLFAHSGTSDGLLHNEIRLYDDRTTFDALNDAHRTWAVYAGDIPQAAAYARLGDAFKDRFNHLSEFLEDVGDSTLPDYSFLEPRHFLRCNSQHPVHSVLLGDQLLRQVYEALRSNAALWQKTLLLVTWDEHGGFPDRETPGRTVAPKSGMVADDGFAFDILGVRVPAVVVSPYIPAGTVDATTLYDHTSIVRTVFETFGLPGHLLARDAQADGVLDLLTLDSPREAATLPPPVEGIAAAVADQAAAGTVELDDLQHSLVQLNQLLDEHRGVTPPAAAQAIAPQASAPDDLERLVAHFRIEHMGSRAGRLRADAK